MWRSKLETDIITIDQLIQLEAKVNVRKRNERMLEKMRDMRDMRDVRDDFFSSVRGWLV